MTGAVLRILCIERTVASLQASIAFYRDALGFAVVPDDVPPPWIRTSAATACLRLGGQTVRLTAFDPPGQPYPVGSTAADLWFQHFAIVTNDMPTAFERLGRYAHPAISNGGPQDLPPSTGSVTAYKFRDPDGHPLELIQFPQGVSDPQWQRPHSAPTLGIDHAAIGVADADRSIEFYTGILGFSVKARQVNSGPGQDRLDGLADTRVDIVGLSPDQPTPHLELLCYQSPRGRTAPLPSPFDIACDRLVLLVDDVEAIRNRLGRNTVDMVYVSGALTLRDPDGHVLIVTEHDIASVLQGKDTP